MAYLGTWKIDDYLQIPATTHKFSTGESFDASSITYRIYEDGEGGSQEDEIISDTNMTQFDSETGFYLNREQLTENSGFETGKCYTIFIKVTVDEISDIMVHTFQIETDGVNLLSTGLDNIAATEPTGVAITFREMIVQLWMRFFNTVDKDATKIQVYEDDDIAISTTQTHTTIGGITTVNKATSF